MQTQSNSAFGLHPAAIASHGTQDQPVERMMATQAAVGRLVEFICGLPVHLSFNPGPRLTGRAQPGDVR